MYRNSKKEISPSPPAKASRPIRRAKSFQGNVEKSRIKDEKLKKEDPTDSSFTSSSSRTSTTSTTSKQLKGSSNFFGKGSQMVFDSFTTDCNIEISLKSDGEIVTVKEYNTLYKEKEQYKRKFTDLENLYNDLLQGHAPMSNTTRKTSHSHHQTSSYAKEESKRIDLRRLYMLQAQNKQLERQIDLLSTSLSDRETMYMKTLHILESLKFIVKEAEQEALESGAEDTTKELENEESIKSMKKSSSKSNMKSKIRWIMAVPSDLIKEIDQLIIFAEGTTRTFRKQMERNLYYEQPEYSHLEETTEDYIEDADYKTTTTLSALKEPQNLRFIDVYRPNTPSDTMEIVCSVVSHLRLHRLRDIEMQLSCLSSELIQFSNEELFRYNEEGKLNYSYSMLPMRSSKSKDNSSILSMPLLHGCSILNERICKLIKELGSLGVLITSNTNGPSKTTRFSQKKKILSNSSIKSFQIPSNIQETNSTNSKTSFQGYPLSLLSLSIQQHLPPFSSKYKDTEIIIQSILHQLQAEEESLHAQLNCLKHENNKWKEIVQSQSSCLHELILGLKKLWEKKLVWVHQNILKGYQSFQQVFQQYQEHSSTSSNEMNPFINLFQETIETFNESLEKGSESFQIYMKKIHEELTIILNQYNESLKLMETTLNTK